MTVDIVVFLGLILGIDLHKPKDGD